MTKFTRNYVERNPYVATDHIEELKSALRKMLEVYWSDDGHAPPNFIQNAQRLEKE